MIVVEPGQSIPKDIDGICFSGGTAGILGPVGPNFAAGMYGGMAFVYDSDDSFATVVNPDTVVWQRVETAHWDSVLMDLVAEHALVTQSRFAEQLLLDWSRELPRFWQVVPRDMLARLPQPLSDETERAVAGDDD